MKLMFLAAIAATCGPLAAQARTAVLLDFSQVPSASTQGSPTGSGIAPPQSTGVEKAAFVSESAGSGSGWDASPVEQTPSAPIYVPEWMRAKTRRFSSLPSSPSPFAAAAVGCTWEPYRPNPRLKVDTERRRAQFYGLVAAAACEAGVPTHLLDALVVQESRYNPAARSEKGAVGMSQLMPGTARQLGIPDPWNVVENLRGGARYLRAQLDEFKRYDLALGAYNAGPARIRQYGRVPAFRETLGYVRSILQDVRWALARGPVAPIGTPVHGARLTIRKAMLSQF